MGDLPQEVADTILAGTSPLRGGDWPAGAGGGAGSSHAKRAAPQEPNQLLHGMALRGCVQVPFKTVVSHNAAPIGLSRTTRTASLST